MACHIQLKDLALTYRWRNFKKDIFVDLNLCIPKGSFTTIVGHNGSGKSSLIKLILGLEAPQHGEIRINNELVHPGFPEAVKRNGIAYLSQQIEDVFFSETVIEELNYEGDQDNRAHILSEVGLSDLLHREVESLSGGEKQSLAIAQFILRDAPVLILDEPSSYLDQERAIILKNYLADSHAGGKTILHVTQFAGEREWGTHLIDLNTDPIEVKSI